MIIKKIYAVRLTAVLSALLLMLKIFNISSVYAVDDIVNIVIDPSHGGTDNGATSVGGLDFQEKDLNFRLAQYVKRELGKYSGAVVNLTRYADYHMTFAERCEYASRVGADIVISLHFNSSPDRTMSGASVCASGLWEYTKPDLGYKILEELSKLGIDTSAGVYTKPSQTGLMWDNSRLADYSGLMRECAYAGISSILVDHCYLTSFSDMIYYNSDAALKKLAEADVRAIAAEYGLTLKQPGGSVERTYDEPYINGYEDGTFRPSGTITRAEAATMLAKLSDSFDPNKQYTTQLSDVPQWAWYYKYVAYLNSVGFITGDAGGTYRPDVNMSKAEFAIMACRYLGLEPGGESGFLDCSGHMADGYIAVLRAAGYVGGDENGEFHPNEDMIRSSVVMMMNRILGRDPVCAAAKENPFVDIQPGFWAYENILEAAVGHSVM